MSKESIYLDDRIDHVLEILPQVSGGLNYLQHVRRIIYYGMVAFVNKPHKYI